MNDAPPITGLDRSACEGLSARTEHVLKQRAFDLVSALLGAPIQGQGPLPDAAHVWIVQGMVLDFLALHLPGPGAQILSQELRFSDDMALGDRIVLEGCIAARPAPETATVALTISSSRGIVAEGSILVRLPAAPVTLRPEVRPEIVLSRRRHLDALMAKAASLPALITAVAWPCDRDSLAAALEAAERGRDSPHPGRPRRDDRRAGTRGRRHAGWLRAGRGCASRSRRRRGRAPLPRRPRRGADEGFPSYRRADGRRRLA